MNVKDALPLPLTITEYVPPDTELVSASGVGPLSEIIVEPSDARSARVSLDALLNVRETLRAPVPTLIENASEGVFRVNVPENVLVDGGGAVVDPAGEGDGEGDDVVVVVVLGDHPSGRTDSRKLLDAVFQCIAR